MESVVLDELQVLVSMYDNSQIHFDDPDFAKQLIENPDILNSKPQTSISLTIKLTDGLEVDIRIPIGYPEKERLSASCRLKGLLQSTTSIEGMLNNEVTIMINSMSNTTTPCDLLRLINFCEEKLELLKGTNEQIQRSNPRSQEEDKKMESLPSSALVCRIWIHSHHIYNKNKRKFLVESATDRNLNGFSLPGKPGFVCVEGFSEDCEDYWLKVRQLNWQKISLIQKEIDVIPAFIKPFEELHCDKSNFIKYLNVKGLDGIIKQYLGF